ncbi:TonB-dependent siderophore receptor [Flavobacterium sp. NRK1]|uniref:TonB-dependent receptor plug domain-containing protein n=1 Tax=Flavobacterium sp. NRK1 TaxID=2954929 RepID=UPI0020920923|nr:TonB-dependent receptor [Flavobacterium sp. NRK1]MCO6147602.1 TonB-dependent receptor [Flavobacterium sp. NRK1]
MHKQAQVFLSTAFLIGFTSLAQETATDSVRAIKTTQLEEVVVTGQIEPQSIKKSVFNVRVISAEDIKRQAGNNLADVLNQYLNITIQPNNDSGRSTVSMFGLNSNYLKVLVDNVPLVSDTGLGNNVDVTQINLDDVEQIEIIEGAMGVTHGANAVSGIINIITKKNSKYKWEISATAQEETIGDEYEPLGDKGRHIQAVRVAHTINQNWYAAIGANRNDFEGFIDDRGGRDYTDYDVLDPQHNRGYSWLPKEQFFTNALVRYQKGNFRIFYKFDYFNEDIDFYNPVVTDEFVSGVGTYRVAVDRRYDTQKFYHHLNAVGKIGYLNYNVSVSHQKQKRDVENFKYYIQTGAEANNEEQTYQDTEVLYSTGTLSNFFNNKKVDLQVGYEAVNTNGYSSSLSGNFNDPDQAGTDLKKRIENYDAFTAAEISVTDKFSVRPGVRYSFQSRFEDQWAASLGLRQLYSNGYEARASYGRSYRTPTYDELYTYMVDANHNIQGNKNLIPENANSFEVSGKKLTFFNSGLQLSNMASVSYTDITDRIEMAVIGVNPQLQYKYVNINSYKMWNFSTTHQLGYNNWQARVGFTLAGISRKMDSGQIKSDDKFLYNYQLNTNVTYSIPKWNTSFTVYYKLNGKTQQYVENGSLSNPEYILQDIQSFSFMDASAKRSFFSKRLDATLGARNIFNVVNINTSVASNAGQHSAGTTDMLMGYGRSYFLKLTYNLNF